MRGRKPKPVSLQIAAGDPRKLGKHKLIAKLNAEPPAKRGLPACPRHLRGRARSAWTFWADELAAMNLDCRCDTQMLEGACSAYSRAVQADLEVARDGITFRESTVDEESGEVVVLRITANPAVAVSNQAWRLVHRFCSEFGLSPVSRTRLSVDKQDKLPDLAAVLTGPRRERPSTETVQ